ncbi:hypothetical protein GOEFS_053_00080 [Gordonia effusa NBRC 100432]|uniref:Phosphopantetheine adenylyltransferase n=1 Tax=Gordonia effusa NBRC 100432 TaxID=1077974 RepID=H0QZX7_9ACTN|nr:hypothetical protein [Gordonia effusa]GAB18378.1 hypothetical protein GOEFS_053_00080 [Gordonia effusa NBRC 100432]
MNVTVVVLLVLVGLINAVPGLVAVVPGAVGRAYDVEITDRNVEMLLRHRAVLLLIVGVALIAGAFVDSLRVPAMIGGAASMLSYLLVLVGGANQQLRRVAYIDIVAIVLLGVAAGIHTAS